MIFVTTGTHYLPFDRLLKMVDLLVKNLIITEEIVIQSGTSTTQVQNAKLIPFLSYQEMIKYIAKARLVITAAGPATVFQVLTYGKNLPVVVPRIKKYGEHVSDHQLYFAKYLSERSLCKLILSSDDLIKCYQNAEKVMDKRSSFPSEKLITNLDKYLSVQ